LVAVAFCREGALGNPAFVAAPTCCRTKFPRGDEMVGAVGIEPTTSPV
jgi:hypothetical protein